jgi:protein ImuB
VDRLGNRLGFDKVLRLAPFESHIPERAARALPAMEGNGSGRA